MRETAISLLQLLGKWQREPHFSHGLAAGIEKACWAVNDAILDLIPFNSHLMRKFRCFLEEEETQSLKIEWNVFPGLGLFYKI